MGDLINLNRARKAKAKAARSATAEANRIRFGRTKAEKTADALDKARAERLLSGAKREETE